jgi:hypothetical protein
MLSLSQGGEWIVNRFGWCQPTSRSQVFDFLPIPIFFVIICFFYGFTLIKYWVSNENSQAGVSEKVRSVGLLDQFIAMQNEDESSFSRFFFCIIFFAFLFLRFSLSFRVR